MYRTQFKALNILTCNLELKTKELDFCKNIITVHYASIGKNNNF
jgi:hypothetical protein